MRNLENLPKDIHEFQTDLNLRIDEYIRKQIAIWLWQHDYITNLNADEMVLIDVIKKYDIDMYPAILPYEVYTINEWEACAKQYAGQVKKTEKDQKNWIFSWVMPYEWKTDKEVRPATRFEKLKNYRPRTQNELYFDEYVRRQIAGYLHLMGWLEDDQDYNEMKLIRIVQKHHMNLAPAKLPYDTDTVKEWENEAKRHKNENKSPHGDGTKRNYSWQMPDAWKNKFIDPTPKNIHDLRSDAELYRDVFCRADLARGYYYNELHGAAEINTISEITMINDLEQKQVDLYPHALPYDAQTLEEWKFYAEKYKDQDKMPKEEPICKIQKERAYIELGYRAPDIWGPKLRYRCTDKITGQIEAGSLD